MGFENVGKVWDVTEFRQFLETQNMGWAKGVTMHMTAAPSLAQRPVGLRIQHIRNIEDFYRRKGWSAGPHLFIDEDQIYGMSSLERRGVHARSFNATHIGIEVLGNYDVESPTTGRGLECWNTAQLAVRAILGRTGLKPRDVNGHRDDPRTNKSCPGALVNMEEFKLGLVSTSAASDPDSDREDDPEERANREAVAAALDAIEWQLKKLRDIHR